jgi:VanZ family protein
VILKNGWVSVNYLKVFRESALWAVVIFVLSVMDTGEIPDPGFFDIPHFDKMVHFGLYFILSFLLIFNLKKSRIAGNSLNFIFLLSVVISSLYGGIMELVQSSGLFSRTSSIADFFANTAGAVSAAFMFKPLAKIINRYISIDEE